MASVLIFEDDVVFADQLERKSNACSSELPHDWDMLFFGALHGRPADRGIGATSRASRRRTHNPMRAP